FIIMATRRGVIKKSPLMEYSNPRKLGIIGITIDEGDELIGAGLTSGSNDILLCSDTGKSIRFAEKDVRPMGRVTRGVRGFELASGCCVVGMGIVSEGNTILTVTENGYGKRTEVAAYRFQGRGGSGVINIQTTPRNGNVVGVKQITGDEDVILICSHGRIIRMASSSVPVIGRNTKGVRLITLEEGEKVVGVALAQKQE
ncbi:MAG TPA: DNA gyrase C-terminal beta-propeller domain-containing protein, partial [Thermodesulfobacteriota bacterium]|nr:DNA gyrase C-terminal beta-propeller domain-containing protein [Thermodesulfobacteriota bacterium]